MKKMVFALFLMVLSLGLGGCQLKISAVIDRDELIKSSSPANMNINLLSKARDVRFSAGNYVGRHTFTLFMLPTFDVTVENGNLNQLIPQYTKEVIERAGFTVTTVDELGQAKGPTLVVQVDELNSYLFSWLYPLGFVFGETRLCLALVKPDGKPIWVKETQGNSGMMVSLLWMSGFETRVEDDLTANLNQIAEIVNTEEFKDVLRTAQGG